MPPLICLYSRPNVRDAGQALRTRRFFFELQDLASLIVVVRCDNNFSEDLNHCASSGLINRTIESDDTSKRRNWIGRESFTISLFSVMCLIQRPQGSYA